MAAARLLAPALFALASAAGALAQEEAPPRLEVIAELPGAPGNITVTPDGLVVVSTHPSYPTGTPALAVRGGEITPIPGEDVDMKRVLSVRADREGKVWLLAGQGQGPKTFYVWDTKTGALDRTIEVAAGEGAAPNSFFNDMALAPSHGAVVVSDPAGGAPALVVLDVATGKARRVLENHPSVQAEDVDAVIDGKVLAAGRNAAGELAPLRGAVNPITIDSREEWVYYGALSGTSIWRVRLADLLDASLAPDALGARVERYGPKPPSAGITIDDAGDVYVTDVQARGIGVTTPDGAYRLLVQDDALLDWPDGIAVDGQGWVYVAPSQLYRTWASHDYGMKPPFVLVRFKALAPTTQGR